MLNAVLRIYYIGLAAFSDLFDSHKALAFGNRSKAISHTSPPLGEYKSYSGGSNRVIKTPPWSSMIITFHEEKQILCVLKEWWCLHHIMVKRWVRKSGIEGWVQRRIQNKRKYCEIKEFHTTVNAGKDLGLGLTCPQPEPASHSNKFTNTTF